MINGEIDKNSIDLSFMASECEKLARGEAWGKPREDPIGLSSMASTCERPRKRGSGTMAGLVAKRVFYAKLSAIRVHLTPCE